MTAVADNTAAERFELREQGQLAYAAYARREGKLFINYVEAAPGLRGTGAAGRLMDGIAAQARTEGVRVVPICGYAVSWFRRHPEHQDLLD
ncbi:MAG: N-acetyltransferase [Rhodospirillaceae bacterium]|nr:N-acetyltransferase [Rhodospirillaceae bacterium]